MTYADTSALVSLNANEPHSAAVAAWCAGDALHLACAEQAGAKSIATLDPVMVRHTMKLKIKPVPFH